MNIPRILSTKKIVTLTIHRVIFLILLMKLTKFIIIMKMMVVTMTKLTVHTAKLTVILSYIYL